MTATIDHVLGFLAQHEACGVEYVKHDARTDAFRRVLVVSIVCEGCGGAAIYNVALPHDAELRRWIRRRAEREAGGEPALAAWLHELRQRVTKH